MIPKTYHHDNPEDRAWTTDFWAWLKDQPKDAWHLWARNANWDNADEIFEAMVDDPECDLALVAFLFWGSEPGFHVEHPEHYRPGTLIHRIVSNVEAGHYPVRELYLDRYEVMHNAHAYVAELAKTGGQSPFRLPRALCGPFDGRPAQMPARLDAETERDLAEIFHAIDGGLPRSEAEHWRAQVAGGNIWIKDRMALPKVPAGPERALAELDDLAYAEAIFGSRNDYAAACRAAHAGHSARYEGAGAPAGHWLQRLASAIPDPDGWTAAKWLFGFFVAAMTVAIVMRRINFGVWF